MKEKKNNCMSRKEFMTKVSYSTLFIMTGASGILSSCSSDDPEPNEIIVDLNDPTFSVLKDDGGWIKHPDKKILLVNVGGTIRAFSSICPHTGCSDDWSYFSSKFFCGCHGSTFSNEGELLSGPATTGLGKRSFTRSGDVIRFD